ncbi:MAG: leucine-rich repeat protein [Clostridia bacterium]|nr:leucine-rich repeat protein [Clostridia bacterium]
MRNTFKKAVSWLVLMTMLLSMAASLTVGTSAASLAPTQTKVEITPTTNASTRIHIGKAGNNIEAYYWPALSKLELTGTGDMWDFLPDGDIYLTNNRIDAPWHLSYVKGDPSNSPLNGLISTVEIDAGITSIGNAAFYQMSACTSYVFKTTSWGTPSQVKTIGEWAFANNGALRSIVFPASTTSIEKFAFNNTPLFMDGDRNSACLGTNVTIESTGSAANKTLIDDLNDDSLNRVIVHVTGSLAGGIAWDYSSATKTLSLTYSGSGTASMPTFDTPQGRPWDAYLEDIQYIIIGDKITNIGAAFMSGGATALRSVTLGKDVESIGTKAFRGCENLTALTLPAATKIIAENVFDYRTSIITVTSPNTAAVMQPGVELAGNDKMKLDCIGTSFTPAVSSGYVDAAQRIRWDYVTGTGELRISLVTPSVTAPIPDYAYPGETPWVKAGLSGHILSITIGDGITRVGNYAFANEYRVSKVTLGNAVASIGDYAFYGTSQLTSISFPVSTSLVEANAFTSSVLWYATKANANMVVESPNIELQAALNRTAPSTPSTPSNPSNPSYPSQGTDISYPIAGTDLVWSYNTGTNALNITKASNTTGITSIPNYDSTTNKAPWSQYAGQIRGISVHSGVSAIGNSAFAYMPNVVDIFIADSVVSIGSEAFRGCSSLSRIALPQYLGRLGVGAFRDCTALQSINIPAGVTEISDYTFCGCSELTSVTLPYGLQYIGVWAFYGCSKLQFMDFPASLTTIGSQAFYGCSSLKGVVFRSPSLNIGASAFDGCDALVKAVYVLRQPTTEAGNEDLTSKYVSRMATGTSGSVTWTVDRADATLTFTGSGNVTSRDGWQEEMTFVDTVIFSDGITGVGAELMKNQKDIDSVIMADTVRTIGNSAFELCTGLTSVILPSTLDTMGTRVFYGCSSLESIDLPDALRQIPESTFTSCTALQTVDMGQSLISIGAKAFLNCTSLDGVVIPVTVTSIAQDAFDDCTGLTELTLFYDGLISLNEGIFDNCYAVRNVYFNGSPNEWTTFSALADSEIKNANVIYCVLLTVHYKYENGTTAAPSKVYSGVAGSAISVDPVVVAHHTPNAEYMTVPLASAGDQEVTFTYKPTKYNITVRFVDADTGANVGQPKLYQVAYNETWATAYDASSLVGYTLETTTVRVNYPTSDQVIQIKCFKNTYHYTVELLNERTGKVVKSIEMPVAYGSDALVSASDSQFAMKGYTIKQPNKVYTLTAIKDNNQKVSIVCVPTTDNLTIHYVDSEGNKLAEDYKAQVYYGDKVSVASPVLAGLTPDKATVALEAYNGEAEITVTYNWTYYTVTISFVESGSIGYQIHPDFTASVKHGDPFNFTVLGNADYATPDAYVVSEETINIANVMSDVKKTIYYTPRTLTLTVNFVNDQGQTVESVPMSIRAGQPYTIESKTIHGYFATEALSGTMGTENKTVTIQLVTDPNAPELPDEPTTPDSPDQEPDDGDDDGKKKGGAGKIIAVIAIIVLVLGGGGAAVYFLYLRKPF